MERPIQQQFAEAAARGDRQEFQRLASAAPAAPSPPEYIMAVDEEGKLVKTPYKNS